MHLLSRSGLSGELHDMSITRTPRIWRESGRAVLRVIHAPTAVAGNAQQLAECMALDGHDVTTLVYEPSPFARPSDIIVWPRSGNVLWREWRRVLTVFRHVWRHDVYIFNYGASLSFPATDYRVSGRISTILSVFHSLWVDLLQTVELLILLGRRVKVVVVFQGDDARQGDVLLKAYDDSIAHHVPATYYSDRGDRRKRRLIARLQRFGAQLVTLNPDLLRLLGADSVFVPYGHIDLNKWLPLPLPTFNHGLVVGHFPSNPEVKGTSFVVNAIRNLSQEGHQVTLQLLSGTTQDEVREKMRECHLIVDQLHAGYYGGVAVEAMALGRTVAAFIRMEDLGTLPADYVEELPVISVTAWTLENQIRTLLDESPQTWAIRGQLSRSFVEKWHNPEVNARSLLSLAGPLSLKASTPHDGSDS